VPRPFSEGEICPLNWGSEKSTVQLEHKESLGRGAGMAPT
jgi:hypothetical protein